MAATNTPLPSSVFQLSELPDDLFDLVQSRMSERVVPAGEFLMRQGEQGDSLVLLLEGSAEVSVTAEGKHRVLQRVGPGAIVGEMALLTQEPRSADVVALDRVRLKSLPVDAFHELSKAHPLISVVLTQLLAKRLGGAEHDALAGKELAGYLIKHRLGRGGMAIVYEALERSTGRRVAAKMMSHSLVYDATALERFQREADIVESFEHENIVRVYGRFPAFHSFFIVMEFCDGCSLDRTIMDHAPLTETETRGIIGQLARGLALAHSSGIVHRDLKPANVMVTREGTVKLMDFGLATPVSDARPTTTGQVVGTPLYMAPEQLAGEGVGREADLFSMGVVIFEMLTGQLPFQTSRLSILRRLHAEWDPSGLSQRLPEISRPMRELLERCLALRPEQRQVDMAQVMAWAEPVAPRLLNGTDSRRTES